MVISPDRGFFLSFHVTCTLRQRYDFNSEFSSEISLILSIPYGSRTTLVRGSYGVRTMLVLYCIVLLCIVLDCYVLNCYAMDCLAV